MQLGAVHTGVVSTHATKSTSKSTVSHASALDGKRLAHDRAAAAEHLEVGHAARTGRDIVAGGGGGKRAKSGGGGFGEERAHGPRLAQKSLHGGQWRSAWERLRRVMAEGSCKLQVGRGEERKGSGVKDRV